MTPDELAQEVLKLAKANNMALKELELVSKSGLHTYTTVMGHSLSSSVPVASFTTSKF